VSRGSGRARETKRKIIEKAEERQVQASTERKCNRIESVDFFGGIEEAGVRA